MRNKIMTVAGEFDVEMTYKPSPDDEILLKLSDAVNRFFLTYVPRNFNPDTGDIMEIVDNIISQVKADNDIGKALKQTFPTTDMFELDEVIAHLTLDSRKEPAQKLIFSLLEKELEKQLFDSLRVGGGAAQRLTLSLQKKIVDFQSF